MPSDALAAGEIAINEILATLRAAILDTVVAIRLRASVRRDFLKLPCRNAFFVANFDGLDYYSSVVLNS